LQSLLIPEISQVYDNRFHYRTHAEVKNNINGNPGFYQKESHNLISFPKKGCLLLAKPLLQFLSDSPKQKQKGYKIAMSYTNHCSSSINLDSVTEELEKKISYKRDISLFFQANQFLRSRMLEIVEKYSDLSSSDTFLDIGCGVGFFTLLCASHAKKGVGIDINSKSIQWAKHNAKQNRCDNVSFIGQSVPDIHPYRSNYHVVIIDPPRSGISKRDRKSICTIAPHHIVYVSCNPTTFSRDCRDFISYGYSLKGLTLIDMFPGTFHIEVIALLTK